MNPPAYYLTIGGLLSSLLLLQLPAHAQAEEDTVAVTTKRIIDSVDTEKVYLVEEVDQMPALPGGGGKSAIIAAIQHGFRYPALAIRKQREGTATVSFTVNEQGRPINVKVDKGLGYGIDEELVRVVNNLPSFIPGKIAGYGVQVGFVLPVTVLIK